MDIESIEIKRKPKIIFMGTPEFSKNVLEELLKEYSLKAVVTQPDKPVGRKNILAMSPVKKLALEHEILVIQFDKIKERYQDIIEMDPDLIITCAYGQILPKELLDYPKYGCINVHASLLPKLRGGAPIHRAIIEDYHETGITIMYMAPGMDDGDIITQSKIEISDNDTYSSLHDKLSLMGSKLLLETLPSILEGTNKRVSQEESLVTFAPIIKKEDEHLDFSKTKREVYNKIRGLNSFPGSYLILDKKRIKVYESVISNDYFSDKLNGEIVKIYENGIGVKTSDGVLILTQIQPEGKSKMSSISYLNGLKENLIGKVVS